MSTIDSLKFIFTNPTFVSVATNKKESREFELNIHNREKNINGSEFEVKQKNELTDKVIAKSIPYPILFIIKYQTDLCYSIKVEDSYYSEWNDNIEFDFNYNNLNSIYENIVKKIKEKTNNHSLQKIILINTKKQELEKQITQLKRKISQEKQFNRKVELNQELRNLEQAKEELNNEQNRHEK